MQSKTTLIALGAVLSLALVANAQEERDRTTPDGRPSAGVRHAPASNTGLHQAYTPGDVLVAIGSGEVLEFTPAGVLVQTLNDTSDSTYTAGMAFDNHGNLYITNFSAGTVSKFDPNGNLVNAVFIAATDQVHPESISFSPGAVFPVLIGDADLHDQNGNGIINQYDENGNLLNSYVVQAENRGTDWSDLQPDGQTVLYTSEGSHILSYNIATRTQNPPFVSGLPGAYDYAHRTLSSGQFAGDDLVADSSAALLTSSVSGILDTYILPDNDGEDFALNLSPDGQSFWTADLASGEVWQVNISTGAILNQWNSGYPNSTGGLAIVGERGQGVPPCSNCITTNLNPRR